MIDYRAYCGLAEAAGVKFANIAECLLANTDLEFIDFDERPTEYSSNIEYRIGAEYPSNIEYPSKLDINQIARITWR